MKSKLTIQDWGMMVGQEVEFKVAKYTKIFTLTNLWNDRLDNSGVILFGSDTADDPVDAPYCKPILRTLTQMTFKDFDKITEKFKVGISLELIKDETNDYILKQIEDEFSNEEVIHLYDHLTAEGFDIRGWIENGLAIKGENE